MKVLRHLVRTGKFLIKSEELPRWLKWAALFAALPIIGPLDELVGIVVLLVLLIFYRGLVKQAWHSTKLST